MSAPDWMNLEPIAHRGLHDAERGVIENTTTAVQAAMDQGYGIEVDLQLSADHRAMVYHDSTLDRLTNETGKVVERTVKELQSIDFKHTTDLMMTLENLLDLVAGRVPLFLEVKSQWGHVGPLENAVAKALDTYSGAVAIMSFDPESVFHFRQNAPDIARGIVADGFHDKPAWQHLSPMRRFCYRHLLHLPHTKPSFIAYNVKYLNYPAPRLMHRLGKMPLLSWTVRTKNDLERANTYGAIPIFEGMRP